MWQQSQQGPMAGNVSSSLDLDKGDKCQQQDFGDSGFLSGTNLIFSEEFIESSSDIKVEEEPIVVQIAQEPMRVHDSGLDLGLSENLGQLTIKHNTLNSLDKVHLEPLRLTPVSIKAAPRSVFASDKQQSQVTQEPWEIYYCQDDDGDTQLHIAVVQGYIEATFCLVNMVPHPCLLDILNDDGQTALHLSILTHQPRIARCLILAGANPEARNIKGNTALHLACACGDIDSARALTDPLSNGERGLHLPGRFLPALPQNLEQRNYNGEMCIHLAASGNHVELVRLLLRLGADLDAREGLAGRTALHLAIEHGCKAVLKFLLEECRPSLDVPNYAGYTAYQIALCVDTQLAVDLIRFGAKPQPLSDEETDSDNSSLEDNDESYMFNLSSLQNNSMSAVRA
ncbi:NF-kappa-B inhibitor cactus-like [Leptopilina heterotoma]|uniref:NF-kappa-B inhibitor cactus-like n=1 Tax=Leptopilina heterotoma TaxID=63436 RepID=UPI001CA86467|nr:NF-kappa-B inhibitor cactus-like [Leptopilina heterotoma]